MTLQRFAGKAGIVTGAASGIGKASALRVCAEGASVAAVDVNAEALAATVAAADTSGGGRILAVPGDISTEEGARAIVDAAVAELGKLDFLANVAGILRTHRTHEIELEQWEQVLRVNLTGTMLMCKHTLPHMMAAGGGAIVGFSSTSALFGSPFSAAYGASKAGITALMKTIAIEYARDKIRANVIAPGGVDTPITKDFFWPSDFGQDDAWSVTRMSPLPPVGFGKPEELAAMVALMCSEECAYLNGEVVRIDGGTWA